MASLFEDLESPRAYAAAPFDSRPDAIDAPGAIERRDTHISAVYLVGGDVFKVKKPVDFGFLDFSTREKRLAACEAEVRLNRRLSPDVYLGVVPITRGPSGEHRVGGDGEPIDHAVHMRRVPDAERADVRLANGTLGRAEIDRIAVAIARFHAACRSDAETASFGAASAIAVDVVENFAQTRAVLDHYLTEAEASEIERFQLGVLRD